MSTKPNGVVGPTMGWLRVHGRYHKDRFEQLAKAWKAEVEGIQPHYDGTIPACIQNAFPNEPASVVEYRKQNYAPKTRALLSKAIRSMYRFFSKSSYSIDLGNKAFAEWIASVEFDRHHIEDYFFKKYYPNRVIDPNALLVVMPARYIPSDASEPLSGAQLWIIPSSQIMSFDESSVAFTAPVDSVFEINNDTYVPTFIQIDEERYHIIAHDEDGQLISRELYSHKLGYLPCFALGGSTAFVKGSDGTRLAYYRSDFEPAIPYLNRAVTFENQYFSVAMTQGYPIKAAHAVTCQTCGGSGKIIDASIAATPDNPYPQKTCTTCNGTGEELLGKSPLEGFVVRRVPSLSANKDTLDFFKDTQPVAYIPGDYDGISKIREWFEAEFQQAKDILNIDKTIKSAQSGTAKELDREEGAIEIEEVAEQVFERLERTLKILQGLLLLDSNSKVVVHKPVDYRRKTEDELYQDFQRTIEAEAPLDVRYNAYMTYLKRRYHSDRLGSKIAETCVAYAPLYLFSLSERNRIIGVPENDKIKALYVFQGLQQLAMDGVDLLSAPYKVLAEQLDKWIQPRLLPEAEETAPIDTSLFNE